MDTEGRARGAEQGCINNLSGPGVGMVWPHCSSGWQSASAHESLWRPIAVAAVALADASSRPTFTPPTQSACARHVDVAMAHSAKRKGD